MTTSLVKLFGLLPRLPTITEAASARHWSTTHRDHAVRIKSIRRYVQLHRTADSLPGFAPSIYDGIPEVWLDDAGAAASMATDPDYTEYAAKDEPNFIDMSRMAVVLTTEEVVVPGPEVASEERLTKGMLLVTGRQTVAIDEFESWWRQSFAPLVVEYVPELLRFVRCDPLGDPADPSATAFDGVAELWWRDEAALARASSGLADLASRLEDSPVDLERTVSLVGEELRVLWPRS